MGRSVLSRYLDQRNQCLRRAEAADRQVFSNVQAAHQRGNTILLIGKPLGRSIPPYPAE